MCLEKTDKGNIKDAVSDARKVKSLVGRWLERSQIAGKHDVANKFHGETLIESDTVVLAEGGSWTRTFQCKGLEAVSRNWHP